MTWRHLLVSALSWLVCGCAAPGTAPASARPTVDDAAASRPRTGTPLPRLAVRRGPLETSGWA
jgi:hypothetical protein